MDIIQGHWRSRSIFHFNFVGVFYVSAPGWGSSWSFISIHFTNFFVKNIFYIIDTFFQILHVIWHTLFVIRESVTTFQPVCALWNYLREGMIPLGYVPGLAIISADFIYDFAQRRVDGFFPQIYKQKKQFLQVPNSSSYLNDVYIKIPER